MPVGPAGYGHGDGNAGVFGHGGLAGGEVVDGKDRIQPVFVHGHVKNRLPSLYRRFTRRDRGILMDRLTCAISSKIAAARRNLSSESSRLQAMISSMLRAVTASLGKFLQVPGKVRLHIGAQQVAKAGQVHRYEVEFHRDPAQRDDLLTRQACKGIGQKQFDHPKAPPLERGFQ